MYDWVNARFSDLMLGKEYLRITQSIKDAYLMAIKQKLEKRSRSGHLIFSSTPLAS